MTTRIQSSILASSILVLAATGFAAPIEMTSQDRLLEIRGSAAGDLFGRPVITVDLNGDGHQDLVVGSDRFDFSGGQRRTVYVFKGGPSLVSRGLIDLSVDAADARILGETGSRSLSTAFAAGDVNGDGIADLALVDPTMTVNGRNSAGAAYILFGRANFFDSTVYDFAANAWDVKILGAEAGDNTGGSTIFGGGISHALAIGDIDNDNIGDLAIGAMLSRAGGVSGSGTVFVVRGRTPFASGTTIDLASQANYRVFGDDTDDNLGIDVTIGDVNNDGIKDLVMGVHYSSVGTFTDEGYVYVMFGRTSFPATTNLGNTAPSLQIRGAEQKAEFGDSVAVGDVTGDGIPDLVAGAPGWDGAGTSNLSFGAIHVFNGRSTWSPTSLTTANDSFGFFGNSNATTIGARLAVGDVNKDGIADMVFSSRDAARPGFTTEGRTFVVFGSPTLANGDRFLESAGHDLEINGNVSGLQLGDYITTGDLDGDGAHEIILAAPFLNGSTGRIYVLDPSPVPLGASMWQLY